jgi:hypothetical protein
VAENSNKSTVKLPAARLILVNEVFGKIAASDVELGKPVAGDQLEFIGQVGTPDPTQVKLVAKRGPLSSSSSNVLRIKTYLV